MICVDKVTKKYKDKYALKDVSFSLGENQILGIVGPNGAGKTTLIRIISNVSKMTNGKITMPDETTLGVVFDYNGLYPQMTASENLLFYYCNSKKANKNNKEIIDNILRRLNLYEKKDSRVKTFSKGMLRKLSIARAVITDPNILILDEPFDGLDIESRVFVMNFLSGWVRQKGKAIILSSHNMSDLEKLCTKIVIIKDGQIKVDFLLEKLKDNGINKLKIVFAEIPRKENVDRLMKETKIYNYTYSENILTFTGNLKDGNFLLSALLKHDFIIKEFTQENATLEELYLSEVGCR